MNVRMWYYYLHTNGDLIGKNPVVVDSDSSYFDSPFVRKVWKIDVNNRGDAWGMILDALAIGCSIERAKELSVRWNLTYEDSIEMLKRTQPADVTDRMRKGMDVFITEILKMDVDEYWTKIEETFK